MYVAPETPGAPAVREEIKQHIENDDHMYFISPGEREVLKRVLDRERTSREAHGGLRGVLSLTSADADVLLAFLRRI